MKLQRLGIDIVGGCNLRCVGCPNSTLDRKIQFTAPKDFNTYLSNIDVSHIEFLKLYNFGEIMLHPDLGEIFRVIDRQRWSVKHIEISTNGQIVNHEKLRHIFSNPVTRFGVSCDGDGTAEEYERLRPPGKMHNLMEFLGTAQVIRETYQSKAKMFLKILCTGNKERWISLAQNYDYNIQWRKWRKAPDSIKYKDITRRSVKGVCKHIQSSRKRLYVDWDGDVVPCCNHPHAYSFGSLKTDKFSEIYNWGKRKEFITLLKRHRPEHNICGKCEVK